MAMSERLQKEPKCEETTESFFTVQNTTVIDEISQARAILHNSRSAQSNAGNIKATAISRRHCAVQRWSENKQIVTARKVNKQVTITVVESINL
jgi:transcription elongation GreA/GreB family factor